MMGLTESSRWFGEELFLSGQWGQGERGGVRNQWWVATHPTYVPADVDGLLVLKRLGPMPAIARLREPWHDSLLANEKSPGFFRTPGLSFRSVSRRC